MPSFNYNISTSRTDLVERKEIRQLSSRKGILIVVGILTGILLIAIIIVAALAASDKDISSSSSPASISSLTAIERARAILKRVPLVDGHNDFAWQIQLNFKGQIEKANMNSDLRNVLTFEPDRHPSQTDIPRLRKGLVGAQLWSAYSPCFSQYKDAVKMGLEQVDVIRQFTEKYNDVFEFVTESNDIMKVHEKGKIASMIGLEGGHMIDDSLSVLRMFYRLGVRYMTLTWSCNTPWADGYPATRHHKPVNHGLSSWGKLVVKEMNRLGMLVDISHVSWETMQDVLEISNAPVIYSHSSSFHMCPHHRNAPDDILRNLTKNGGMIMVNFYPDFINCTSETVYKDDNRTASLQQIADHLDHIKGVIGPDHIGLGSDFDGSDHVVKGMEDVSKYPDLFAELITRNWTEDELEKLAYRNFFRVLNTAEKVRDQKSSEPPDNTPFNQRLLNSNQTICHTQYWETQHHTINGSTAATSIGSTISTSSVRTKTKTSSVTQTTRTSTRVKSSSNVTPNAATSSTTKGQSSLRPSTRH